MFNTILGQDRVVGVLRNEVVNKTLTNSMLFYGDRYTGKLTAAFELARILNCKKDSGGNCECDNCKRFKSLSFDGVIFLSRRNFTFILNEYIKSYKQSKDIKYKEKIYRIIKLSFLPLQDFLINSTYNDTDKKVIASSSEKINDIINKGEYTSVDLENIVQNLSSIYGIYKNSNIPIDTIREMLDWTYLAKRDINKVVIIDDVDKLEDSSKNILLKRLEEPSSNLYFILLAENKNRVIQTIRSRCRSYYFTDLSDNSIKQILSDNFGVDTNFDSLKDFFHQDDPVYYKNIEDILIKVVSVVFSKGTSFTELGLLLSGLQKDKEKVKSIIYYFKLLLEDEMLRRESVLHKTNKNHHKALENISYENLNLLIKLFEDKYNKIMTFNLNPGNQLEGMLYPIKELVLHGQI